MSITDWIAAELAEEDLRLADEHETCAWWEKSSVGMVRVTTIPPTEDLVSFARAWDGEALRSRMRRAAITPQILADTWRDGCTGRRQAAEILTCLAEPERARLEVGLWNIFRQQHSTISLVEVRIAVELASIWPVAVAG